MLIQAAAFSLEQELSRGTEEFRTVAGSELVYWKEPDG